MAEYEKQGYLNQNFRIFHLADEKQREFSYHYHDFNKIVIFIRGDVTYCVEGKSYELSPYDLILVNRGDVHRPIVHSRRTYERIIVYISPDFLDSYKQTDYDLGFCFMKSRLEKSNVMRIPSLKKSKLSGTGSLFFGYGLRRQAVSEYPVSGIYDTSQPGSRPQYAGLSGHSRRKRQNPIRAGLFKRTPDGRYHH